MNHGILEGIECICDTMDREMLLANHKDKLPLICFVPTLPHHSFVVWSFILNYLVQFFNFFSFYS